MKIWGTLSTFAEPVTGNKVVGRQIASEGFLRALFHYSSFDEFHFFVPNFYTRQYFAGYLEQNFAALDLEKRVRIMDHIELPTYLERESYEVFHLADFTTYLPALAHLRHQSSSKAFPITGVTWSISERDYFFPYLHMMMGAVQKYDGIVCISHSVREVLAKAFEQLAGRLEAVKGSPWNNPVDLKVLPLGIDEGPPLQGYRSEARRRLGLPEESLIVLIFGRYSYADKMDLLPILEMIRRLKGRMESAVPTFCFAGSDPNNYAVLLNEFAKHKGVESHIVLRTNIPAEEKPYYYASADIFLSPSDNLQESFGLTIIEAMAAGLPVVASDFDGYRELIQEGVTGFRIPSYWAPCDEEISQLSGILAGNSHNFYLAQSIAIDLDVMVDTLERLARDPALRQRLGEAGREKFRSSYSWKQVMGLYEDYWNELRGRLPIHVSPAADPFQVPHWKLFSHYPTHNIRDVDVLSLTETGVRFLDGAEPDPRYPELLQFISKDGLRHALALCRHDSREFQFLRSRLEASRRLSHAQAAYHLLWALKHGLLRLVDIPQI